MTTSSILRDSSKAMYQPWREEAFRADEDVQALTPIERWMLRALLQAAFVCSQRPYLPDDDARLWKAAGCESREQWDEHKAAVLAMFNPVERDGQKLLSHKKLVEDWGRIHQAHTARVEAGRKGGRAKAASNNQEAEEKSQTEGNQTEGNQPNQPTEVTELNVASHSSSNAREGRLEGRSGSADAASAIAAQSEMPAAHHPGTGFSSPSASLGSAVANHAPDSPRSASGKEKPVPGDDGGNPSTKDSGQGKRRALLEWEAQFQREVQRAAAEGLTGDGQSVVFSVPLPDTVFRSVEQMGADWGMEEAQAAVLRWLNARNFGGLANPNIVWNKMPDEVPAFIEECEQREF